ncbi:MAG: T9SS type A sorting domain-containing protein [Phycisphaerales bacterium]|nr:T9SS type A sorting domain-containing protein [Phycisphaerales bacterium]
MERVYLFLLLLLAGYKPSTAQFSACTTVDYIQAQYLLAGGVDGLGGKGMAISADGNTMAVANTYDKGSGTGVNPAATGTLTAAGAVYVYTRTDSLSHWVFQAYIKASNTGNGDLFGHSLALSADGNTLAVGAYAEAGNRTGINPPSNDSAAGAGAVYTYTRSGSTWSFSAYIKANNTNSGDNFGISVSLSGDGTTLAVGAYNEDGSGKGINPADNNSASGAGAVYIYTRSGSTWSFSDYIKASNTESPDNFGNAVSLSSDGTTLAVSAYLESGNGTGINPADNNLAPYSGAVYIYTRSAGTWSFSAYVKASNTSAFDFFGNALSLSGDGTTLAVGSSSEAGSGKGINPASNDSASGAGAVYIYTRSGSTWSFTDYIKASNTDASDLFGISLSLSNDGTSLAVGANGEAGNGRGINPADDNLSSGSGAAYVFKRTAGVWAQNAYIKAPINVAGDGFGTSVSLSANGANLVVGAPYDKSSGLGVNPVKNSSGTKYGAVWVYNQYGVAVPRVTTDGIVSQATICTDPLYIYLKDTSDMTGHHNIARILKNGNSFSVDSAFVDADNTGTYLATGATQSTQLMRRMLRIHTTPATGLTVNGGPIVRFYYDTSEKNTQIPTATYPTQLWFKHPNDKASTLADLVFNNLNNSTNLVPVASGFDSGVAYVDVQVTSFSTFGALGSTGEVHLRQFEAKATNSPKLYPTMTQDKVNVWLPESYADAQIMVFNLNGQRQYVEQESNGAYRVLRLAALAQGLYFVRIVQNDGNTVHFKVIKQ